MEIMVIGSMFHDTDAQWIVKKREDCYEIYVGSEEDRVVLSFKRIEVFSLLRELLTELI